MPDEPAAYTVLSLGFDALFAFRGILVILCRVNSLGSSEWEFRDFHSAFMAPSAGGLTIS